MTWASEVFVAFSVGSRNCRTYTCCQQLQHLAFEFWDNLGHHTLFFRLLGQHIPSEAQCILQPPAGVRKQWGQRWHSQSLSSRQGHVVCLQWSPQKMSISAGTHSLSPMATIGDVYSLFSLKSDRKSTESRQRQKIGCGT